MIGPNLSAFATRSRAQMVYFMLIAGIAGSFVNLGRDENPTFAIKTMLLVGILPLGMIAVAAALLLFGRPLGRRSGTAEPAAAPAA